jgi:two-component system, sensor histidine kinase and response regulator
MTMKADILIVDDVPANLELMSSLLAKEGYNIRPALNGKIALTAARNSPPDLVLLDIDMPDLDGYQVCEQLKADEATAGIPIIFVSAMGETIDKIQAFSVGGVDYITKPFQLEEMVARIETHLTIAQQRRELEDQYRELAILREHEKQYFSEMNHMKDQFIATVSHDLKNPINIIMGYVDLLLEGGTITEPDDLEFVRTIGRRAESMFSLVKDLLDLARLEAGMALLSQDVSLTEFLQSCYEDHQLSAWQKEIRLAFSPPQSDVIVKIDPKRMGQVMNNLISNAIKYSPESTEVQIMGQVQNHAVFIQVQDHGRGIPEESLPHLFEKFYRVPDEGETEIEGTGLGLAIVKSILDQQCAQIEVQSELGVGTTFTIILPHSN